MQHQIPASLIRGGTSKGLFFNEGALPPKEEQRDQLLLSIMGSPDPTGMQLNGMGGGISSASKVVLVSKSKLENIDVNYLFGQVSLREPHIDWKGSCGNLAAAVALYAVNGGFVQPLQDGAVQVNIWQANLEHEIQVKIYSPHDEKNFISIPGVPGKGVAIYVDFLNPSASLLPDNQPIHALKLPNGRMIEATLIKGANPSIFVYAKDLNLTGDELPKEVDFQSIEELIQSISVQGAQIMQVPYTSAVRVAWVASPKDYTTSEGSKIYGNEFDILSRISTEGRIHHAHTGTGAVNLACAVKIPGSIPYQIVNKHLDSSPLRIGHPMGILQVNAKVVQEPVTHHWIALSSGFMRTAKILMSGTVYS